MGTIDLECQQGLLVLLFPKKEEDERGTWSRRGEGWKGVAPSTRTHLGAEVLSPVSCLNSA